MPTSATRRATTVRTLAGAVLAAALVVPVATACGSTSAANSAAAPVTTAPPAATTPVAPVTPAATAPTAATPTTPTTPVGATSTPGRTAPTAPTASTPPRTTAPAGTAKAKGPVHTFPLVDGSTAEVQATGNQNHVARIVHNGAVLATLETKDADAGLDGNGMFVVLSLDGQVHSWTGGEHQGPGTFKLAGGWTAKVTKIGDLHYRAEILGLDNAVMDTLEANQHDVGAVANDIPIVLTAGGEISSHA
ncbi:hypothetical protein [Kitasatospora sp. NPDC056184]|uniref:hypothetical protein n=1 Tax=Kitasatospora sp. NPDC056184 TaxID=3345738 RepID=UPI0035E255AF